MQEQLLSFDFSAVNHEYVFNLPFEIYCHRSRLPDTGGIYFIVMETTENSLIYIGMTNSFSSRFQQHSCKDEFDLLSFLGIRLKVHYLSLQISRGDLELLEYALIRKLDPVLNKKNSIPVKSIDRLTAQRNNAPFEIKQQVADKLNCKLEAYTIKELIDIAESLSIFGARKTDKKSMIIAIEASLGALYDASQFTPKPLRSTFRFEHFGEEDESEIKKKEPYVPVSREYKKHSVDNLINAFTEIESVFGSLNYSVERLTLLSIRDLKYIASELGVYRYSYLSKDKLATEITKLHDQFKIITTEKINVG